MSRRILIIDDDPDLRETMRGIAAGAGHEVEALGEGAAFLDAVARFQPDRIVMDLSIPDLDGVDLLKGLSEMQWATSIVLVSSHPTQLLNNVAELGRALGLDMDGVLQKPFSVADFLAAIDES